METLPLITKDRNTLESSETMTATTGEQAKLIEITCCKEIFTCKACNVSGRGTRFSEHLMKHLLLLPYKCLHCDESFSLRKEIGAHMQKKHPGKEKKSALRANKRANTILGEAEKKGSCSFKSSFVHISPKAKKKSNDGTLHASVSSSNTNINNSNFNALEPEKNAQVSNTESEEGKQNESHDALKAKSHCEKKIDRPNVVPTFSNSKSESFRVAVGKNVVCATKSHLSEVVDGTEGSENMPVLQTESNVQLNRAESKNITLVNPEDNIVPSKPKSADKTNVGESGLLTNENHVDKCSFVSSFQNAHSYDNQKENSNEDNNSGETNSGNVTASENGIIKGTALMNGGVLSSDVKQTQEHYVNSEKQIDCEQTDETYQDVVPKVKVPAQQVVVTDNDKVDNSPVKNSLRYADDCKYNSVEHATSDKSYLVNTSEHTHSASAVGTKLTENNSKSQTVSTNTCNSSILTTKPKSTVSSTFEMEAKNKSHGNSSTKGTLLHRSEISQSKFDSQAVSNIQQQSIASVVQPSTQIFKLIGPGVVSQYVHVQNVQNKVVIPPVVCAGRASVSAVNNTTFTPVTPFGVINTPETMTSYIVVPLSVPHMTFAPVANVQQGVFPVASQRTVATVADSMYKETQIVPNLQGSHSYAQRIIIQNQNVVPVPVAISGEDTNTSPRNKGELCTSNERVEPEKEYVSEKIEKAFDIVFEEVGNEKGDNEKKADILTAIVGDEYFCGKCRIRWKKKELFWFHLWNHQHIGGILCNKCIRINGPAGELSCAWTDSFISKLQEKKEKNSKMYSIVRVDCTPNVPVNENKATLPADEDKARCSAEENKTSFPTDESEHDSRAQETDNNEQHAEDNDSNDMGLKILECKSLNIEEFDEISSGEQNSVETIKSNSGHGEQEKEKEKENPSDSDNPGQDNLEMCLKNSNSDQGEQEKKIPSDSYNPGQDNLEMCLKNSSSIDDLISEAQKHLPSEKMLSCDESVTMDHFVPFEEELNVDAEYLPNESGIAMDLSSLKNNSEIFSHVQPPAYHFYVCGGTCSFTCLLPGDFKQHLTTCKCINRDLFACFHCRFVGESVEALLRHMHKHAVSHKNIGSKPTNAVFVCSITNCKFSTNILNAFYCHCCQVHPNESSHTCVSCEESFQTAEDLAQHLKVNLLSVVSCKHCMAKDIDKNIVMEHILFEHPGKGKMLNTVKELLCKDRKMYGYYTYQSSLNIMDVAMSQSDGSNMQDSFQASSEQQMEESKKPNRSSSKDSMCCHICNFVASAVSELKQHLTCHEQTPAEDGGLSFICPACPMQVKTLKDFEDHAACHAKNVSFWLYDCPLGDYQTNQVTLMLQHIKKEGHSCESGNMLLGNEKYIISKVITCTCCKFRTTSVAHLNDHMKGHSIITAKDPAVRVAAHSTTDVDATSESVHRTHSHRQNATTTKDRVRHCSKDESKLVKNSTKRRFSSDASKISEAKDSVIFTLPYDSVFQTAVACPQCSFSAFFKTNMLKHIKEKHPMVKVKESSQTVSPVQAKSPKTALSSSNEMCGLEDSNSDKLEGMKLGSSELDTTLATFYKKSGSVLICKICEKQCSKKKILHHHILDHLKLNLWKCTSCDFKDNRRFVIIKHAKKFHSSSDGCVAPVEDFLSRLSEHKCKKGPRKPSFETTVSDGPLCSAEMNEALKCFYKKEDWCLECVVCKMKCSSVILMHKHVLQIHLKHAMFGCNLCWFEGFEEHEVLEHLHAKHPSKPATVLHLSTDISATVKGFIDSCPTSTKSLLLHQNIKKKKLILGNDDMDSFLNCLYEVNRRLKLVCLICKEELSTKYASHRHILAHLGVDLVGCSCCSFQSLSDRDVTEHMKSNHAGIQLKIDYLDVDIAEAVKNFFENSCKTPSKEKKSKGVMHKRQTVERSKATSSTSKVRKPWKGPSSSDAHMGNKKDVTKKIVGGLTKYKCRFCEYLALSVRSVRAHIFRSHPKTEGNLFKCSKCPFQVESLVEITTHMFQKHPWTLEDGFEDCHPSIVSQTNDRVHSTHSGNPFVELEASDSVHSTHSCIEAETSEKDSEEMLLVNKPFTEPVSSTKSTLNDGSTDNIQESISMHAENCLKQSYLGFEHITDQVNANEADHSTCKSSGHHHGVLTDTHPRLDKDVDKISDNDEYKNLELCSMDNEVALNLAVENCLHEQKWIRE
ncbi:uncharacterized protein LOC121382012 [Gigantopelta aegis]|uniref:uncharacterized protein LOC121382012 n=1 Tax=Gigantopelta aegis TaxID=1735272 RepID=UPI001B8884B0|nr:uncharacterized protein LOC121382012 [Gigantopelta aegis]